MANSEYAASYKKTGAPIATDAAPTVRADAHCQVDGNRTGVPMALWISAVGGAPTVTVSMWDRATELWLPLSSAAVVAVTAPTKVAVPDGAPLHVRVTADGGCTTLSVGFGPA
jgi:hypothetical protein